MFHLPQLLVEAKQRRPQEMGTVKSAKSHLLTQPVPYSLHYIHPEDIFTPPHLPEIA